MPNLGVNDPDSSSIDMSFIDGKVSKGDEFTGCFKPRAGSIASILQIV